MSTLEFRCLTSIAIPAFAKISSGSCVRRKSELFLTFFGAKLMNINFQHCQHSRGQRSDGGTLLEVHISMFGKIF